MKLATVLGILFVAKASALTIKVPPIKAIESEPVHGDPLPLMWIDNNHSIVVDYEKINEVFNHPEIADRKIVAVSVIGALRKGKSFFMSYCLRYLYRNYKSLNYMENPLNNRTEWIGKPNAPLKGFSFRGGSERHTTGIIMWSDIFLHEQQTADGSTEKLAIILLDTQGLFDTITAPASNTRIFALGTLISSLQIFNIQGNIQEDQLEYLRTATDYAHFHANITSQNEKNPFQKLLFLIRDWTSPQDYLFGKGGGDGYLKHILTPTKDQSPDLKGVRDYIRDSFDDILCFLLPHPGANVTKGGYDGRNSAMDDLFRKELITLIEWLFKTENLVKKRILDDEVTGSEYGGYITTFFEIFQSPNTPDILSVYNAAVENQLKTFLSQAMKHYISGLGDVINDVKTRTDLPEFLDKVYEEAQKATLLWFKSNRKMGTKHDEEKFIKQLVNEMKDYYIRWKTQHVETWTQLNENKKEHERLIKEQKREHDEKIARQLKEAEDKTKEVEEDFKKKLIENNERNDMTLKQKDEETERIKQEKIAQEAADKKKLEETKKKLKEEAERARLLAEERFRKDQKKLQEEGSGKASLIERAIMDSREIFMQMIQMQTQQQLQQKKEMQERWDREDKLAKEQREELERRTDQEAKLRREELDRLTKLREAEIAENRRKYDQELADRKMESKALAEERAADRERFEQQMQLIQIQMNRTNSKAQSITSSSRIASAFTVAVVFLSLTFSKKV